MRIQRAWSLLVLVAGVLCLPSAAGADTYFTPYLGSTFAAKYGPAEPNSKLVYGGDVMWLGTSGVGFELDFAYHPNFFEPGDEEELFDFESDGNVLTFMSNLVFGYRGGGIQPVRHGRLWSHADQHYGRRWSLRRHQRHGVGRECGGGLRVGGQAFGVRGDLRYFRQLSDVEFGDVDVDFGDFWYWRGTVGVSFGF